MHSDRLIRSAAVPQDDRLIHLVQADTLEAMTAAFLDDCALANLSPKTLRFYRTNLDRFGWWCAEARVPRDPTQMTAQQIRDFLRYVQTAESRWGKPDHGMSAKPATDKTVHAYYRVLRRFFGWLVEQEYLDTSPMARIRAPKMRKESPEPFSADELARISATLTLAGDGLLAVRNRAIIAFLLDQGLRASELCGIMIDHINIATGDLVIVHGKGD